MAFYLFNIAGGPGDEQALREDVANWLTAAVWPVAEHERHRDALAAGDRALIYIGAPVQVFVGCVELASSVQQGSPAQGVPLRRIARWEPPVPIDAVLERIDRSAGARADFEAGVLRITETEFTTAVGLAAG